MQDIPIPASSKKFPLAILKVIIILLWAMPVLSGIAIISAPPPARCYFNPATDQCYPSNSQCYFDPDLTECFGKDTSAILTLKATWGFLFFGALFGPVGLWVKYGK